MRLVIAEEGKPYDLILAVTFSISFGLVSLLIPHLPGLWLPILVTVFFLPGYCVLSAIAPGKGFHVAKGKPLTIPGLERVVVSIMLSIFLIALISTLLSWSDWGLTRASAALEVSGITTLGAIIAYIRRSRLPFGKQFTSSIEFKNDPKAFNRSEQAIVATIAIILIASVSLALMANKNSTEPYTQLTITGPGGTLSDLPLTAAADQDVTVRVTILNKMNIDLVYNLTVGIEGTEGFTGFQALDWFSTNTFTAGEGFASSILIGDGQSYSANLVFSVHATGTCKLIFLLDAENVHRDVWLFLTVI